MKMELEKWQRDTALPCAKMLLSRSAAPLDPCVSKMGGVPYVPFGFRIPRDSNDEPMTLLGQVNCSEVPGEPLPGFPKRGMFQFWTSRRVGVYGMVFSSPGGAFEGVGFKAVFHEDVRPVLQDAEEASKAGSNEPNGGFDMMPLPFVGEIGCSFEESVSVWNSSDEHSAAFLPTAPGVDQSDEIEESGHRVGGYAFFTQFDPRDDSMGRWRLLWQVDTDGGVDLMWGDAGVGGVFILEEDLAQSPPRVDRLLYNWDCC